MTNKLSIVLSVSYPDINQLWVKDNKIYHYTTNGWEPISSYVGEITKEGGIKLFSSKNGNIAAGKYSVSAGENTLSKAYASATFNENTVAENEAESAFGVYNVSHKHENSDREGKFSTLYSVGCGNGVKHANAIEIMRNGDIYIKGIGGYDGTNPKSSFPLNKVVSLSSITTKKTTDK